MGARAYQVSYNFFLYSLAISLCSNCSDSILIILLYFQACYRADDFNAGGQ